jgi:hypothetical protein
VPSVWWLVSLDLINLFLPSLLGNQEIAAAVGFYGVVNFFHLSLRPFSGSTQISSGGGARAIGWAPQQDARRPAQLPARIDWR